LSSTRPGLASLAHEATFGGPLIEKRAWLFSAAAVAVARSSRTFDQTGGAYVERDADRRLQLKLTARPGSRQTVRAGYALGNRLTGNRPSFPFSIDRSTLGSPRVPAWYAFASYRGSIGRRFVVEAQLSTQRFRFDALGGTSRAIADSPFLTLFGAPGQY